MIGISKIQYFTYQDTEKSVLQHTASDVLELYRQEACTDNFLPPFDIR